MILPSAEGVEKVLLSDENNNVDTEDCHGDPKVDLIDELKQIQEFLDLKRRADKEDMELLPKSYQIIRQYPILSSRDTLNKILDDASDNGSECLEDKNEFVHNGFGRLSVCDDEGAENNNSVDEITIYGNITRKPSTSQR